MTKSIRPQAIGLLSLLSCLASAPSSQADSLQRKILTEDRGKSGTLVLVLDVPNHKNAYPIPIFRKLIQDPQELKVTLARFKAPSIRTEFNSPLVDPAPWVQSNRPLWELKHKNWTLDDERDYARWIENEVDQSFLTDTGVIVDCVDFTLAARWVYARNHGLPAANSLPDGLGLFGHWSALKRWDSLPEHADWRKDERFKAGLQYLLDTTYTRAVIFDLYPVHVSREWFTPGVVFLSLRGAGIGPDTQMLHKLAPQGSSCADVACFLIARGNEPRSETITIQSAYFFTPIPNHDVMGKYRWPRLTPNKKWELTPQAEMPGYSTEQFGWKEPALYQGPIDLYEKLGFQLTVGQQAVQVGMTLLESLKARSRVVAIGHLVCHSNSCAPGTQEYDDYSTPSRDAKILNFQKGFAELASKVNWDPTYFAFASQTRETGIGGEGSPYAWLHYLQNKDDVLSRFQSDPNLSFFERWGLSAPEELKDPRIYLHLLTEGWAWREDQLRQAQNLCFKNGSTRPICDVSSDAYLKLATTKLDHGLREARLQIRQLLEQDPKPSFFIRNAAAAISTHAKGCGPSGSATCSLDDLVFGEARHMERMTARPSDPYELRMGQK